MKYILGLDLGIASIGWAIYNEQQAIIEKCGVRLFPAAENYDKSSLAATRREARSQRRTIRRRAFRMQSVKKLLVKSGIVSSLELENLFNPAHQAKKHLYDVYYLRYTALTTILSEIQLAQVLIHMAKHRGFKSNRKNLAIEPVAKEKSKNDEDKKVNASLQANSKLLEKYRTVGEMLYIDEKFGPAKRNHFGEYKVMLQRSDVEKEAEIILETQQKFGNRLITSEFIRRYIKIFNYQKPFDYKGDIQDMVGLCQFEANEKRAPKACYSSEKFIALSKLNNMRYSVCGDVTEHSLTAEEINKIFKKALTKKNLSFKDIREELGLSDEMRFKCVPYRKHADYLEAEKKTKIKELELPAYRQLKEIIENKGGGSITWNKLLTDFKLLDQIAVVLTYNKADDTIKNGLEVLFKQNILTNNFTSEDVEQIIGALVNNCSGFDKNINLSLKCLYKITPHLEEARGYYEACKLVGYYNNHIDTSSILPSISKLGLDRELNNPVVIRAISQLRKVVNAIVTQYGPPYQINIELARDIGKSAKQRGEITSNNKQNENFTKNMVKEFKQLSGSYPKKDQLLKYRLWKQQDCRCVYSCDYIPFADILNGHSTEVDHIIPYSRSFGDSLDNKVLCKTAENQNKGSRIPFEYISSNRWHEFEEWCKSMAKNGRSRGFSERKLQFLLLKKFDKNDEKNFIERNLNDTRYISRFCHNYLNYLKFSDQTNKKPVRSVTGQATAFIRKHWGLRKSREENDLHHAQDACVIAAFTDKMVQRVGDYKRYKEDRYGTTITDPQTGEIVDSFPVPSVDFIKTIDQKVQDVFVSRMPQRTISGKVHDDTVRSIKYMGDTSQQSGLASFSTNYKPLKDSGIKLDNLSGEIKGICPSYKTHNPNIYALLKQRLEQNDNDCKKAFATSLFAPRKDGRMCSIDDREKCSVHNDNKCVQIKSVKTIQTQASGVFVHKGKAICDNSKMVRIDIFQKDNKNYIVPIYLADVVKDKLPTKTADGTIIDASYSFYCSLYSEDLLKITKDDREEIVYYKSYDRASPANIGFELPDGSKYNPWTKKPDCRLSIQKLHIEKYQVDVLGNITKAGEEQRLDFSIYQRGQKTNNNALNTVSDRLVANDLS